METSAVPCAPDPVEASPTGSAEAGKPHVHGAGGHGHHHGHSHGHVGEKGLRITLILAAVYMAAEAVAGYLTGSLALFADAGHMLSDVAALALSLFAFRLARRPPTAKLTYGHHRTEILAALINGGTLVGLAVYILIEACRRLFAPPEVNGPVMMAVAGGGLLFNLIGLHLLSAGRNENLNVRGAWLHIFTDALGSAQTIVAGALIWVFDWRWADPVASILISLLVIYSSWSLLRESIGVLMEGVPEHLDLGEVRHALADVPGVVGVHDLHVWTITSGREALSAHLVVTEGKDEPSVNTLTRVQQTLHDRFGIHHVTVQLEADECGRSC